MKLKELLAKLETAAHPVATALHKGEKFKTIAIGFKKGMILKGHRAHLPSQLFVLPGKVIY
jgi:quercetin dioxygenase-like cupin family protein